MLQRNICSCILHCIKSNPIRRNKMVTNIENLTVPVQELNTLAVKNIEKLAEVGLKSIETNTTVVLDSLKKAVAVKDVDGWKNYLSGQIEVANEVFASAIADARKVTEIGEDYVTHAQGIVDGVISKKK